MALSAIRYDADGTVDPDKRLPGLFGTLGPYPRKKHKSACGSGFSQERSAAPVHVDPARG